jgi:hypothetical protein
VRYLPRHLDFRSMEQAIASITRFYPNERFPQKTLHALAEPQMALDRFRGSTMCSRLPRLYLEAYSPTERKAAESSDHANQRHRPAER